MPISLGINIASLTAQRALSKANSALAQSYERLSSGLRINRPSDDPAGLAVAEHLESKQTIFTQGVRNLNDGTSLITIASNAIDELGTIISRLKELASQASNGAYTSDQRVALDKEAQALAEEYGRIAENTTYNGQRLFVEVNQVMLQAHDGPYGAIQGELGGEFGGTATEPDQTTPTGTFGVAASYAQESQISYAVTLGDLNGDGNLDLVTAGDSGLAHATVRLGAGDGTFGAATSYSSGGDASNGIALGDLNGDGNLDLLTANGAFGEARIGIRFGVGDGTFGAVLTTILDSGQGRSYAVTVGDVNGDGKLDLVTALDDNYGAGYATVRLGVGDGTFGAATSYVAESSASYAAALSDLNGDGHLDLITAGDSSSGPGYATVRLGVGDGTFGAAISYAAETTESRAVALEDLNGDGKRDLVTTGISGATGYTTVRLGVGDGTFGTATSYAAETSASYAVSLADLDGDGTHDLITAGDSGPGYATIRFGVGDGTFGTATSYVAETAASRAVAVGDLNEDGHPDLVTAGFGAPGAATVRLADTTVIPGYSYSYSGLPPFSLLTIAEAEEAVTLFEEAGDDLSIRSGIVGAFQSRVSFATSVVRAFADNAGDAAARITDVDVAHEVALLVSAQIRQQAATAVLAQANQQPALALQLLSGR